MQQLLAALGARLAPPPVARRLAKADLPEGLAALYAVTDGADLPLVGWRILALHELGADLVVTDAGHRVERDGRVTHGDESWPSVEAFLRDVVRRMEWASDAAADAGTQAADASADAGAEAPSDEAREAASDEAREADEAVAEAALVVAAGAQPADLLRRVCRLVEAQGYRAILTGNPFELRLQGDSGGSWYSIEPWVGRHEPDLAERIAERFVRRERARDVRWMVRCDDESIRTADLSEVVRWVRRPWRSLRVHCDVAEVSLGLYREDPDHLVSFEWHGGRWQARARLSHRQVQATVEHLLLRRDKWPGLEWSLMRQPPS